MEDNSTTPPVGGPAGGPVGDSPKKSSAIPIIVVLAIVLLVGSALAYKRFAGAGPENREAGKEEAAPTAVAKAQSAVTLTSTGFEPATITVAAGTQVVWTNKSGTAATVNSDDHPTHLKYPPLNLGQFADGASLTLVFDTPGSYGYHDHLKPAFKGTVVVK